MQAGSKVRIENGKVFRTVANIDDAKMILQALDCIGVSGKSVISTRIEFEQENTLEHDYIPKIIHSGEFTETMAYDVNKIALNLNSSMYKQGVYSFDLLPHNFTFYNGKWILFDFGAFELKSTNVKTLIRNFFKISFSSFELLKMVERKDLKHYFLNRIRTEKLKKMLPLSNWISIFIESQIALFLCAIKLHRFAYNLVESRFNKYYKNYRKIQRLDFVPVGYEEFFEKINEILIQNSIKTTFGTGLTYANWAISGNNFENFAYIDDYNQCDNFYRYIYQKEIKNVSTAVLYPLVQDMEISGNLNYRALYDSYAQKRFESQACLVLDLDDLTSSKAFDLADFSKNISKFCSEILVIRIDNSRVVRKDLEEEFAKKYEEISFVTAGLCELLVAKKPISREVQSKEEAQYNNDNRMQLESLHTEKIIEILKNKKA